MRRPEYVRLHPSDPFGAVGANEGALYGNTVDRLLRYCNGSEWAIQWPDDTGLRETLLRSLVGSWRLEELSGMRLDSIGSNHLDDNNTVTQAAGIVGQAASFDSANSEYLSLADNEQISHGDYDWTWTGWFWLDSSGDYGLVSKGATPGTPSGYEMGVRTFNSGTSVQFSISDGTTLTTVGVLFASALATSAWHMFRAWFDSAANTMNIIVNEALAGQAVAGGSSNPSSASYTAVPNDTTNILQFGREGTNGRYLNGRLDAFHRFNKVLATAEARYMYNNRNGRELWVPA